MKIRRRILPLLIVFLLLAGLFFLPGLAAANSTEIIPDPGAGGTWTVQWFTVTNQLNLSQPGAPMQTESMRVNAVEFNGVSFTISAFDYPSGTPINQDPSNLWTLMGAQRGVRADQIVVIDINDPLYANGGVINFYFSPPNWEYVPNTGNSTVRVYTPAGWRQVMAATGTTAMTTPMDNRNITTVQLGADIDLRNDQLNGTFNLNRNKQSLTINGLKPGASGSVGSSVNTLAEARSNYFTFVDFFPTTANPLDVNNTTTVPAAGTLNSFTWSNTVIITGSGTGVIYAQGRTGFTQNFNNIFHIGPQLAQANLGQVNLGNTISIIQDPRFHSTAALTSNSFTYIDANGQVQNIILNMGRGTVSYWGSAANASNVTLSGDTHIFRSNRNGTNTSTANVSRHGVFSIFGTAGNLRIADNSNVTIIHNHTHTSNANGLTPLVRAAGGYNIHVGNNSDFSFTNAHHINTNTTAASRPRNIVVGSNSNVDFQSTLINTSTAAAGRVPYLNMSGQMIIGNNSTVNISSPQNRRVPLLVAADNANALNINGGTLNVSGWYNHTGNANIGMVRASNVSINSEGSANLINHATGGPVLHANQVNVNTEGGFVVAGNHGANHLSNITRLNLSYSDTVTFANNGTGKAIHFRTLGWNVNLFGMEYVRNWGTAGTYNPAAGSFSVGPVNNWTQLGTAPRGFDLTARISSTTAAAGGSINDSTLLFYQAAPGAATANPTNATFGFNNKAMFSARGNIGPFEVALHWNDGPANADINLPPTTPPLIVEVAGGRTVLSVVNLEREQPVWDGWYIEAWYSDQARTEVFDIYRTPITAGTVLYALWAEAEVNTVYEITYLQRDLNTGEIQDLSFANGLAAGSPVSFISADLPVDLIDAYIRGLIFLGWFESEIRGEDSVNTITSIGPKTFFSRWEIDPDEVVFAQAKYYSQQYGWLNYLGDDFGFFEMQFLDRLVTDELDEMQALPGHTLNLTVPYVPTLPYLVPDYRNDPADPDIIEVHMVEDRTQTITNITFIHYVDGEFVDYTRNVTTNIWAGTFFNESVIRFGLPPGGPSFTLAPLNPILSPYYFDYMDPAGFLDGGDDESFLEVGIYLLTYPEFEVEYIFEIMFSNGTYISAEPGYVTNENLEVFNSTETPLPYLTAPGASPAPPYQLTAPEFHEAFNFINWFSEDGAGVHQLFTQISGPYDLDPWVIYGVFEPNGMRYNINYYNTAGASNPNVLNFNFIELYDSIIGYDSETGEPIRGFSLADPSLPGYTFNGWYDAEVGGNQIYVIPSEISSLKTWNLWADFEPILYDISYWWSAGNPVPGSANLYNPDDFNVYELPIELFPPTYGGTRTFIGWYDNETGGIFVPWLVYNESVQKAWDLWARFADDPAQYNITYIFYDRYPSVGVLNGVLNPNPSSLFDANIPFPLNDPIHSGRQFVGWYTDSDWENGGSGLYTFTTQIENPGDQTLYGRFTTSADPAYNVTFNYIVDGVSYTGQGIANSNPLRVLVSDIDPIYGFMLNDAVFTGHTFTGWFSDEQGNNQITHLYRASPMQDYEVWGIFTTHTVPPVITTTGLPVGVQNQPYTVQLEATGDVPMEWTWVSASGSALPPGLTLDNATGLISGMPTGTGSFIFNVTATNGAGSYTKELFILISATAHTNAPVITTVSLPVGVVGASYSASIAATGDTPMQWFIDAGSLPAGLTLDPLTGAISGTPSAAGTFNFTVNVSNNADYDTKELFILISATPQANAPLITTISLPVGAVGEPYSYTIAADGDTPMQWFLDAGSLPAGLTFNPITGEISGMPTTANSITFTVNASNSVGSHTADFFILISAVPHTNAPIITTTSLPVGVMGASYSASIAATGDTPMQWFIDTGSLPAGLTLNPLTGAISGTPSVSGTFNFTANVSNNASYDTRAFTLLVSATPQTNAPVITTTGLPVGAVGESYSFFVAATGDTPMQWFIDAGSLPAGLTLNLLTGEISGIPTAAGTSVFIMNASNNAGYNTSELFILVSAAPHTNAPVITTTGLPVGAVGLSYSASVAATGDTPMQWFIDSGSMPAGLTLDPFTGVITGTPSVAGTFTFTVNVSNNAGYDTRAFALLISDTAHTNAPIITTVSLPVGAVGESYSSFIAAAGDTPMQWFIDAGSLPAGLTLNLTTGEVSGIPTTAGTFIFTANASNNAGYNTKELFILISAAPHTNAPIITTTGLPVGAFGEPYSASIEATGDTPMQWFIDSGALPGGLTLNSTTGVISGTPDMVGTFNFTVNVSNNAGYDTKELFILIGATVQTNGPVITTISLPVGAVGASYSSFITATGDTPMQWFIDSGALPAGLTLNPLTGEINGTPSAAGTFDFTVNVSNNADYDTKELFIIISATVQTNAPIITTVSLPVGAVGESYSSSIAATGDTPMQWFVEGGSLPGGLTLNPFTGVISGTPSAAGTFVFTVNVSNNAGYDTEEFIILISAAVQTNGPVITTVSLPVGVVGQSYSSFIEASGDTPMQWFIDNGALPGGLTLNPLTGEISGTPSAAGTFTFTVNVSNNADYDTRVFTLLISATAQTNGPVITTISLPVGAVGESYSSSIAATGDTPMQWFIDSGALPGGLTLNPLTGEITGTPSAAGTFTFTVNVSNNVDYDTKELFIIISATVHTNAPIITTVSLPVGVVGTSYSSFIEASGDTPMQWFIDSGALPGGLTLNPLTGEISGMPDTVGIFNFTANVSNNADYDTKELFIIIGATVQTSAPVITTAGLPVGAVGASYSGLLEATGDTPMQWFIDNGALPGGLTLNSATGEITGTPSAAGTFTFTVNVSNNVDYDTKELFIIISATVHTNAPVITTVSLPVGAVGASYSSFIEASGDTPMQWFIDNGALPSGLTLNPLTGEISGTPGAAGTFTFTVNVSNNADYDTKELFIIISASAQTNAPVITTISLPVGVVGTSYSSFIAATGDTPMQWFIDSGALPGGLTLDSTTGAISGTPSAAGTFTFTVNAGNNVGYDTKELFIIISATVQTNAPVITTTGLPVGAIGESYSSFIAATGDTPMQWFIDDGALPGGLTLNPLTGEVSGISGAIGTFTFIVNVSNNAGYDMREFTLLISDGTHTNAPVITTISLPVGAVGASYSGLLEASGDMPMQWFIDSGALPGGLTLNSTTGEITGTPDAAGTFTFIVNVSNNVGYDIKELFIIISATVHTNAPVITTTGLPFGIDGVSYSSQLEASGDVPMQWFITDGALPDGLTLDPFTGEIFGIPGTIDVFTFTVYVGNNAGSDTKTLTITIYDSTDMMPPRITTTNLPAGNVFESYSATLTATGSTPIWWSIVAGDLPDGLTLDTNTGVISGIPLSGTENKVFVFTVQANNDLSFETKELAILITDGTQDTAPVIIMPIDLPPGVELVSYNETLTANGSTPRVWYIVNGSLPIGLSLNFSTGEIVGIPESGTQGVYVFTALVRNAVGDDEKVFVLLITDGTHSIAPTIITTNLPAGTVSSLYTSNVAVLQDGDRPMTWVIVEGSGSLPAGLSLDPRTGVISGTPATAGTFGFIVKVTNGAGFDERELSITINSNAGGGGGNGSGNGTVVNPPGPPQPPQPPEPPQPPQPPEPPQPPGPPGPGTPQPPTAEEVLIATTSLILLTSFAVALFVHRGRRQD